MIAHSLNTGAGNDQSMATSGDYRNFFEVDGVRYSHTIDPRTRPADRSFACLRFRICAKVAWRQTLGRQRSMCWETMMGFALRMRREFPRCWSVVRVIHLSCFGIGALTKYGVAPSADQMTKRRQQHQVPKRGLPKRGCRNAGHRAIPRDPSDDRRRLWIDTQCHGDRSDVRATLHQRFLWWAR